MAERKFEVVGEETDEQPVQTKENTIAVAMLTLSLKALGQRALVALADLFCLFTALTVFWLWLLMPEDPSPQRLVALGMYAMFIIGLNLIVRQR